MVSLEPPYAPVAAELRELLPVGSAVVDAHTHLGRDEDGQSLETRSGRRLTMLVWTGEPLSGRSPTWARMIDSTGMRRGPGAAAWLNRLTGEARRRQIGLLRAPLIGFPEACRGARSSSDEFRRARRSQRVHPP